MFFYPLVVKARAFSRTSGASFRIPINFSYFRFLELQNFKSIIIISVFPS